MTHHYLFDLKLFNLNQMQNELLGNILNNIVMEKVVRDKIVMQQKEQREAEEAERKRLENYDELDEFEDQETKEIMRKMKEERLRMREEVPESHHEETRTVGEYREITQDEFLNYVTKLKFTVVHFFHKEFQRCTIMHKHLSILCQQFPKTQFLSIQAEKAPFFVQKLSIKSLPTLCFFIDGVMKDKLLGFDGLSGDEFLTYELAARMNQAGVIQNPKEKIKDKTILKGNRIRGKHEEQDQDSDSN